MATALTNPSGDEYPGDDYLVALARQGDPGAYHQLAMRYHGFIRAKAYSYFLSGADVDHLTVEGLIGLYRAVRDYRSDRESAFRTFAELCITRAIIKAVRAARHRDDDTRS